MNIGTFFFWCFCIFCDRTVEIWQEACEREKGCGIWIRTQAQCPQGYWRGHRNNFWIVCVNNNKAGLEFSKFWFLQFGKEKSKSVTKDEYIQASAQIMEKAANAPARPCPLMMGVVYDAGSIPPNPNRLPCRIAPNAAETDSEEEKCWLRLEINAHKCTKVVITQNIMKHFWEFISSFK